jgi:hypothetical protein
MKGVEFWWRAGGGGDVGGVAGEGRPTRRSRYYFIASAPGGESDIARGCSRPCGARSGGRSS